jgi:transposase
VNDVMELWRETGSVAPKRQGNGGGHGKLAGVRDWLAARVTAKPDLTLDELAEDLAGLHAITVHPVTVWRTLKELDPTHKKSAARRRATQV